MKHRKSGATAGACSGLTMRGREVLARIKESPAEAPWPHQPQGKEQAIPSMLMQIQEIP